jgi:hypothetical protein
MIRKLDDYPSEKKEVIQYPIGLCSNDGLRCKYWDCPKARMCDTCERRGLKATNEDDSEKIRPRKYHKRK